MREFFLKDYYLNLPSLPQAAIRIASFAFFAIFMMSAIVFIFSDAPSLPYVGALILLVVADQFLHYFTPQKSVRDMPRDGKINVADYLSPKNKFIFQMIRGRAAEFGESFSLNFLMYAMGEKGIRMALRRLDVNPDEFADKITEKLKDEGEVSENDGGEDLAELFTIAIEESLKAGESELTVIDLFIAVLRGGSDEAKKIFGIFGITAEDLRGSLIFSRIGKRLPVSSLKGFANFFSPRPKRLKKFLTPVRAPILSVFSSDMTKSAAAGRSGFMMGHRDEYDELVKTLIRPENAAAALIGGEGIGKETIAEHLAYSITRDDVPKNLFDKRVYRLDVGAFLEGEEGMVAERIETAFRQATAARNVIVYIPKAADLLDIPPGKILSASIEGAALSGKIGFILADSRDRWERINKARWFKAFKVINVVEMTEDETINYLAYAGFLLEKKWGVKIKLSAVKRAVILAKKYSEGFLPGSAERIIEAGLEEAKAKDSDEIGPAEVMAGAIRLSKNKTRGEQSNGSIK